MDLQSAVDICCEIIQSTTKAIITTHINPDGDAVGSSLALCHAMKSLGIEAFILSEHQAPYFLKFLPGSELFKVYNPQRHDKLINSAESVFFLDLNDSKRVKSLESPLLNSHARKVVIDHHIDPKSFAEYYLVDTDATSTGEIIWRVIKRLGVKLNSDIATNLYTAILTDTGSFRFQRTDAELHRIVAELIDAGADPTLIYDNVYNNAPLNLTKLLGLAISGMKTFYDGKLCIMYITDEMFKATGTNDEEVEGFVEKTLMIAGVQAGILLTEVRERSETRISFRSKGNLSVRELAAKYGGGGHVNASGARICNMDYENVLDLVIKDASMMF